MTGLSHLYLQISIRMELNRTRDEGGAANDAITGYPPTSLHLLALVVRHEVAHIKHGRDYIQDRACSLWAMAELQNPGSGPVRNKKRDLKNSKSLEYYFGGGFQI